MQQKWILFLGLFLTGCSHYEQSLLGPVDLSSPLIKTLHESTIIQRLKGIEQGGTPNYYCNLPKFTRYDHSLGVLYLIQRYGGSEIEQAAALTHDASHTVFSHVADVLFEKEGYQDHFHEDILNKMGIEALLKPYHLKTSDINPDKEHFKRQEQPLPDMCADRIEYNLHTAFAFGIIKQEEIYKILSHLHFKNDIWYFDDKEIAKQFATFSLIFTEHVWGSQENSYIYQLTSNMLKRAFKLGIITEDVLHFGKDQTVIDILNQSQDKEIIFYKKHIQSINLKSVYRDPFSQKYDTLTKTRTIHISPKFRGIDPYVKVNDALMRLSELDESFKNDYHRIKKKMKNGFTIKIPIF